MPAPDANLRLLVDAVAQGDRDAVARLVESLLPDRLLDVEEAAQLVRRSVSWMRHHGRHLPGFRQLVPGGRVGWSEAALRRWVRGLVS